MSRVLSADLLRRAMVARGLNKTRLAKKAGVDKNTITRALNPDAELTIDTENKIVAAISREPLDGDLAASVRELAEGAA